MGVRAHEVCALKLDLENSRETKQHVIDCSMESEKIVKFEL